MTESKLQPFPTRSLGTTGLQISPICVGSAPLGDMPETFDFSVSEEQALTTIRAIFDGPVNFIDTAASYGDGESERRIGLVLRERGGLPDGFVLASKADRDLQTGDFSGDQVRRSVERSLTLLGLERLQLCYLHDPEHTTFEAALAPGGPVEALQRCRQEGLIQHIGVAGGPIDLMIRYVRTNAFEVAISHNRYTLLNIAAAPFWDVCRDHGVAAVNAAPYGSGILVKGPGTYPRYAYQHAQEELLERTRQLERICMQYGVPLGAAALQFSLRDPRIVATIVGMTRPEELNQTIDFARLPIPDAMWNELSTIPPTTRDPEEDRH